MRFQSQHGLTTPRSYFQQIRALASRWPHWLTRRPRSQPPATEPPLRAELFGVEQLARHARELAANHQIATQKAANPLLARLDTNEQSLRTYNRIALTVNPDRRISPAGEWLLDNFYLIEEQIQMARRHLPRGYSRELPHLLRGPSAGLPRVYDIVLELISHVDAQIDAGPLSAFIAAYQTISSLSLGELWAIPIMLRLALIENLQRVATRLILAKEDREVANLWADRLQEMAEQNPSHLVLVVADMARADLPFSSAFVAEVCQRLSRQNPVSHLARTWLEQRLTQQGLSIEELIHQESQYQAADRVSVSHSIASLRFLSAMDWKEFVESLSVVEETLRSDPAGIYRLMDFATRDRYRHAVESLARHSQLSETDVARSAIKLAKESAGLKGTEDRTAHVGFYLIDKGHAVLGRAAKVRWPFQTIIERSIRRFPLTFYAGGIGVLSLLVTFGFIQMAHALGVSGWRLLGFTFVFLLCASQLAVALLNWLATLLVKPQPLPRMDYASGIPADCSTIVVVPTMLASLGGVDRLIETLEIHHLGNRDEHIHFGLLTDFRDAAQGTLPPDEALLQRVTAGVEMLNRRYAADGKSLFFLFHRPRRWNAAEDRWMGYERKRGKLAEFNAFLRGGVFTQDSAPESSRTLASENESRMRVFTNPTPPTPDVHLLSNGHYHVVVTSAGGGYSRWGDLAVTRWREDATRDNWGTFVYLRDLTTGDFWSSAFQPTLCAAKGYEAIFSQARAEFRQCHSDLEVHTEISVSPEDDVELRRITITNRSSVAREIELTSYAEVVLAPAAADAAHPAFSDLFVQTELDRKCSALLCTRRGRTQEEKPPWLLHLMVGQGGALGAISCETDRAKFIGRAGTLAKPAAMQSQAPLSDTVGSVLDPIVALRRVVALLPNETATISLVLGAAETREAAMTQVEKYQSVRMAERAFDLAWTHSQVNLRQLNASEADAQLYDRMAGALIYADCARRANASVLRSNRRGQSGLWSYGVSGDSPVVLLRIRDASRIEIVRQLVQAHSYWRMKGLTVELVILNEDVSAYRQPLYEQITSLIAAGTEAPLLDKPGGIFVCRLEQIPQEDRILLQSVARIAVDDERGTLAEQMDLRRVAEPLMPTLTPVRPAVREPLKALDARETIFQNGLGGFTRDGHEYVTTLHPGQVTPAPWVNVLANPTFGTVVSESGSAYTWVENSHEFRLTPWSNDPVQDTTGEAFYIRDELTGQVWSPTPLPARGATPYVIRHGFGYTVFEHCENGIASELWIYVAMDAPVKFNVLKLRNVSGRPRRISATGYWEWVLGDLRQNSLLHVQTEVDLKSGALLARNYYNTEFPDRIAFIDTGDLSRTVTGDRKEFLGRNGTLAEPAALKRTRLSGKVGAGLDPGAAVQVVFDLAVDQERETRFRLGVGRNLEDVQNLVRRFRGVDASRLALEGVWSYWNHALGAVNVDTPDPAVNVLANGWLLYQVLSCRYWGRTGFYQSGGAYGFRDQLQDVMALVHAEPALTREHLLRAAARQFREGDVQHWWHPPAGRGVRTHISDDYLWLPYVTCRYVTCLADIGVLDENISFLEARPVKPEEESYYDLPNRAEESATLYQHCVRAIEHGLRFGEHGLPLMGCGDWNDGMNLVGKDGRGESVWLAFFLFDVLTQFSKLAQARNDTAFAEHCLAEAQKLRKNIEAHTWDGDWYLRAYFDNGEPLGSRTNPECQIDSLPQSWSVISGAGDPERSRQAMQSVDQRLVRRESGLIQLFDPPFDKSALNPGYIKGYIPGVRENGGQYTHGAVWTAMAFALMGESERAWELFSLLNPVHHSATPEQIAVYKVEPYVVAADVYGVAPHTGRGGWTWYTGSAGWMYRLLVETLLGVNLEGDRLLLNPRLPKSWPSCKIHYRFRQTVYHVTVFNLPVGSVEEESLWLDGQHLTGKSVPLRDDRQEHTVEMKVR